MNKVSQNEIVTNPFPDFINQIIDIYKIRNNTGHNSTRLDGIADELNKYFTNSRTNGTYPEITNFIKSDFGQLVFRQIYEVTNPEDEPSLLNSIIKPDLINNFIDLLSKLALYKNYPIIDNSTTQLTLDDGTIIPINKINLDAEPKIHGGCMGACQGFCAGDCSGACFGCTSSADKQTGIEGKSSNSGRGHKVYWTWININKSCSSGSVKYSASCGGCSVECYGSCYGDCYGNCTNSCAYVCWADCNSDYDTQPGHSTKIGSLAAPISYYSMKSIKAGASSCGKTCGGSCSSTTENYGCGCGATCFSSCMGGSTGSGSGGSSGSGESECDCSKSCNVVCEKGCHDECDRECSKRCSKCTVSCYYNCTTGCDSGCNSTCYNGCVGCGSGCSDTCYTACIENCYNTCLTGCEDSCIYNCGNSCEGAVGNLTTYENGQTLLT